MRRDSCPWMRPGRGIPLDEDGQRAGGQRRRDTRKLPAQRGSVRPGARALHDLKAETPRDAAEVLCLNHPSDQPLPVRHGLEYRTAEVRPRSDITIDDRDQLQILLPKRDDPVGGTPTRVLAAGDRFQAKLVTKTSRSGIEIVDGIDDVIDADVSSSPIADNAG